LGPPSRGLFFWPISILCLPDNIVLDTVAELCYNKRKNGRIGKMKKCDYCGKLFEPRRITQRFCCRTCSDEWFARERREAVRAWREVDQEAEVEQVLAEERQQAI
jgi:hypothetical protein